jgi:hypothetical protein
MRNLILGVVCSAAVIGCGADRATEPSAPVHPAFSMSTSGERSDSGDGFVVTAFEPASWSETTATTSYSSDVTLLSFASTVFTNPQAGIGLLGKPRVGTYRVRVAGAPLGATPEFYGSYSVTNADGTRTVFEAGSGTVTITDISNGVMHGAFDFHASHKVVWPAGVQPGTTVTATSANLDVRGAFTAAAP